MVKHLEEKWLEKLLWAQVEEIAEQKMKDLNAIDLKGAVQMGARFCTFDGS